MNSNDKQTKYSGLMLLCLIVVGILCVTVLPKYNLFSNKQSQTQEVAQTAVTLDDLEFIGIDPDTLETIGAGEGSVKAESTASGGCTDPDKCDANMSLAPIPLCSVNDAGGTMTVGTAINDFVDVNLNAKVEPFKITTPQVLLQGSKYVDDSRKQISYDYPVYRDSQHIILDDEARRTCAPGVDCAMFDETAGKQDSPFKVQTYVEVKNADAGGDNGAGNTVIYSVPSLRSACPDVQRAKANPRKTSQYGLDLDLRRQAPSDTGHQLTRSFGATECLRKPPSGKSLPEAKNFVMCTTDIKPTDFMVAAYYAFDHWIDCLKGDAACEETRVFAIRIDPFYGGQMKCAKPDCSIRYFEFEYLKNVAPGDAASQIPEFIDKELVTATNPVTEAYYIQTPCKIRIDKWGVHDIPCIWDISPYKKQFQIQKAAYMPLDPTMPQTFDEYWNGGVMPELKKRSISCS